ncbi:MAG TPA: carbohydrate ABC transporter permease [Clostridiales bacterium]|nr:carbohydrate ABC transporter permease [Clostridiales bacterium]
MKVKVSPWNILIGFVIMLFAIFCMLPMVLTLMVSITSEDAVRQYGYQLIPKEFSLYAYKLIFHRDSSVMRAYAVTVSATLIGTVLATTITVLCAYLLHNKNVRYRNHLALFFFVTMIFNAGLVPWYMMCRTLGLTNNYLALIIPSLVFSPFNMFLVRNFMNSIPDSIRESATMDGAGDFLIVFRIYFPLCSSVIATIALFYGLGYWNNWFSAIMLIDDTKMYPLQYTLMRLQSQINMIAEMQRTYGRTLYDMTPPTETVKMATAVVTIGPIVLLYPFLQRFFVKGIIVGAVKG